MARRATPTPDPLAGEAAPPSTPNVGPNLIAQALTEITGFDSEMASIAGKKGAAISRYEAQGVDRELLRALGALARKDKDAAAKYIAGLTGYAVAAKVIAIADETWTKSVKQAEMFQPATGESADKLATARAHKQGYKAGLKGHSFDSTPYAAGSPEYVGWRNGCQEGLEIRALKKPGSENVTPISAARGARRQRGTSAPQLEEPASAETVAKEVTAELDEMVH